LFSPLPCHFIPPRPKYSPQNPILKHPQTTFLTSVWATKFHTHTTQQAKL
jgi:hypothetical protein